MKTEVVIRTAGDDQMGFAGPTDRLTVTVARPDKYRASIKEMIRAMEAGIEALKGQK